MSTRRTMVLVDGENLTMRYQEMLAAGKQPLPNNIHQKDVYVWNPRVINVIPFLEILRVAYYTYAVGTEEQINQWADQLKKSEYVYRAEKNDFQIGGYVNPKIFKKQKQSAKKKGVDISIAVDSLTLASNDTIDIVFLITGDGDYAPLIDALMRAGKRVYLGALSSGLNSTLPNMVDRFECLDAKFFGEP